jgi:hypothetical protein
MPAKKGAKGGKAGRRHPTPAPAPAGFLGFSASELLLVGGSLAAAVLIGLYLGGFFS